MKKRLEDATLLALKEEDGAASQGMQQPLEARKGKKMDRNNQNWLFLVPGNDKTIFIQNKRRITKNKNRTICLREDKLAIAERMEFEQPA